MFVPFLVFRNAFRHKLRTTLTMIGIVVAIVTWNYIDFDKPELSLIRNFDWWGLISMGVFLGALEYVLEEGPQSEWLQDTSVAVCAAICVTSAIAFFWRVLTAKPHGEPDSYTDNDED